MITKRNANVLTSESFQKRTFECEGTTGGGGIEILAGRETVNHCVYTVPTRSHARTNNDGKMNTDVMIRHVVYNDGGT